MNRILSIGAVSGLVFILAGCATVSTDPDLVFHCTFDDEQSILAPAAGCAGTANGAKFVEGKVGKALYVPAHAAVAEFPFPNGLPTECGTIEFWAKLEGGKETYSDGGDPYFFALVDNKTADIVFELHFNANNGCNKSGVIFGMPGGDGDASFVGGCSYAKILGMNTIGWHRYSVVWNTSATPAKIYLYIDGKTAGEATKDDRWVERFARSVNRPLRMVFSNPRKDFVIGKSPYAIDDVKVLKSAIGK